MSIGADPAVVWGRRWLAPVGDGLLPHAEISVFALGGLPRRVDPRTLDAAEAWA